ncbi:MAG: hypothetical protein KA010_04200 [Saprospiraceae bacterium]|nr:hypothetical protein [Saprospiraceae bacterium]
MCAAIALSLFVSCKGTKKDADTQIVMSKLPQDFIEFMEKFHTDSAYQMEHITFPLQGLPMAADSVEMGDGQFRWQKNDWTLHKPFDTAANEFNREFIQVSDDIIIEKVSTKEGSFGMERRFSRMSNGWNLIYYAGFNRIIQKKQ